MNELVYLISGLCLIHVLGHVSARYRELSQIGKFPNDVVLGVAGLAVFFVVHRYAPGWSAMPLLFAAVGLGSYVHVMGASAGAKARPPELPRLLYGTEMLDYYYKELSSMRIVSLRRDEFQGFALRNGMNEEQFEVWAKTKEWG